MNQPQTMNAYNTDRLVVTSSRSSGSNQCFLAKKRGVFVERSFFVTSTVPYQHWFLNTSGCVQKRVDVVTFSPPIFSHKSANDVALPNCSFDGQRPSKTFTADSWVVAAVFPALRTISAAVLQLDFTRLAAENSQQRPNITKVS